jgi:hypothetical protein
MVENLPSKYQVLSSKPQYHQQKIKRKIKEVVPLIGKDL